MGHLCINHVSSSSISCYIFFSLILIYHYALGFFIYMFECPPTFLAPLPPVVCADAATLRLNISTCSNLIWPSSCPICVVKLLFIVVSSVNAAYLVAISNGKLMKV